jgi:hypothetical protein
MISLLFLLFSAVECSLEWSWDTVQTYVHCANRTGAWNDEALKNMSKSAFVVFEKNTGLFSYKQAPDYPPAATGAEAKILAACKQLKSLSPKTDCYMYTESDWARTFYTLGHTFDAHPDWCLRHADGTFANTTDSETNPLNNQVFKSAFHAYDFTVAAAREAWIGRVTDAVATGYVDGAFIDGNRGGWGSSVTSGCSKDKQKAWSAGLNESHRVLRQRLGPNKTLISNYATNEALEWCTGGMVERFTPDQGVDALMGLAKRGKLADIHAQYASPSDISRHLAAFLVVKELPS